MKAPHFHAEPNIISLLLPTFAKINSSELDDYVLQFLLLFELWILPGSLVS